MSIDHFTLDPRSQVYTLHFSGAPAPDELASTLWRIGEFSAFVAAADVSKVDDPPTICFTLLPGRDPVASLDTLRRIFRPRLPYTLTELTVTVTNERCHIHSSTHVKALYARGLAVLHDFLFAARIVNRLMTPEMRALQLARNIDALRPVVHAVQEAQGVYLQGEIDFRFVRATKRCPDCVPRARRRN